jgi:hypothetical protein
MTSASHHLRSRQQVRQILQRAANGARSSNGDRDRLPGLRIRTTLSASGAAQIRRGRQSDRHGRFSAAALERLPPTTDVTIIDMVLDKPDIRSVVYRTGGLLSRRRAHMMASKSEGRLHRRHAFPAGWLRLCRRGATDTPTLSKATAAAWFDPTKGRRVTSRSRPGADVVYAAAGGTGVGVCRRPRMPASSASGSTRTRTGCSPARC